MKLMHASLLLAACSILQSGAEAVSTSPDDAFAAKKHTDPSSSSGFSSSYRSLNSAVCSTNPLDSTSGATDGDNGYSNWLIGKTTSYDNYLYLATKSDQCNGMAFHWSILEQEEKIQIAVAVKIANTAQSNNDGWVGIGFTEAGGMRGADIVYFESASMTLVDAHVGDGYMKPTKDETQDWTLLHGERTDDGFLIFEAERDLILDDDTTSNEDNDIVDDSDIYVATHKMIGAWSDLDTDTPTISFHGKNVIQQSIQLFSAEGREAGDENLVFKKDMDRRADGVAILKVSDYLIPTDETTYEDVCFTVSDLVKLGLYEDANSSTHVIGFRFIVDDSVRKHVHHMLLDGHFTDVNEDGDSCDDFNRRTIAGWAPGQDVFYFPEGTGLEVGNVAGSFNALTLQIHYDNADGDTGQIDNGTGVEIYYSQQPVEHEIGMAIMGDGLVILNRVSIGNGKSRHDFTCPSSCTRDTFDVDEVTVVMETQHMHAKGKREVSQLFRSEGDNDNDEEEDAVLVNKATAEYWDFDQSGFTAMRQKPYKLKKGDRYTTTCYFESDQDTVFGLGSADEMCMTFLYYYPKQPRFAACSPFLSYDRSCVSKYEKTMLEPDSNFDRHLFDKQVVEPKPDGGGDSGDDSGDDSNASATSSFHGVVLFLVLSFTAWLQHS